MSFCRQLITVVIAPFWLILVATVGRPHNTQAAQAVGLDSGLSVSVSLPLQRSQSFFNRLVPCCIQCAIATTSYEYRSSRSCAHNTTYSTHVHSICAHNTLPLLSFLLLSSALLSSALLCRRRFLPPRTDLLLVVVVVVVFVCAKSSHKSFCKEP